MKSKYDAYWERRLHEITTLINEAFKTEISSELDVSDLKNYGKRRTWYGTVEISRHGIRRGKMAHARSLGKVLLRRKILDRYGDTIFRLVITSELKLRVYLVSRSDSLHEESEVDHLCRLYKWIHEIVNALPLYTYKTPLNTLPEDGLYFFFEEGEICCFDGRIYRRIVRVGTHKEQHRLRRRIYQHFSGNRNSSVFRRHLGAALIKKAGLADLLLDTWLDTNIPISEVEDAVSKLLKERFSFACIEITDREERLELEERIIATLARCPICKPSPDWLGHYADRREIRQSGLWNVQHVNSSKLADLRTIRKLRELALATLNTRNTGSLTVCFLPCSSRKKPSGRIIGDGRRISVKDVPNTWECLRQGRKNMHQLAKELENVSMDLESPETSAICLYNGKLYRNGGIHDYLDIITDMVMSKRLRIIIISAWYGIIDAFEPIHEYNARLIGKVAHHWRTYGLERIIADLLLTLKPFNVFGFFVGSRNWSSSGSKYRYFFTEGLKIAVKRGLHLQRGGCFYREQGYGFNALVGLGQLFVKLLLYNFDEDMIINIMEDGWKWRDILIGYEELT